MFHIPSSTLGQYKKMLPPVQENAPECLPYASTAPKIVRIPAFLFARDGLLKCVGLDTADFRMSYSDIG